MAGNGITDRIRDGLLAEFPRRRGFVITTYALFTEPCRAPCVRIEELVYLNNGTEK
jgi:hypothetical protein